MLDKYINEAVEAIQGLRALQPELKRAVELIAEALSNGSKLMTCGNGGSAAEAGHLATELLCRFKQDRPSLPAINLSADGSFLTAVSNDYQFANVFSRQVEGLGRKGDVLVVFTTSGNSRSVLEALKTASTRGMRSVAFLGRGGGEAKALADVALVVPSDSTAHIQEAHQVLMHYLCMSLEFVMFPGLRRLH